MANIRCHRPGFMNLIYPLVNIGVYVSTSVDIKGCQRVRCSGILSEGDDQTAFLFVDAKINANVSAKIFK